MKVEIVSSTPNPEMTIAECARTCYDSKAKDVEGARKMIKSLIKAGHTAMIEHASITFKISGISRVVTHELVRHRIASYAMSSQRYVNESVPTFVVPNEIASNNEARILFEQAMQNAWFAYKKLQEYGLKNEIARYVLPNAAESVICTTINFRALRNFFKLRLSKRAQPEIRELANLMLDKAIDIAPSCFEDLKDESNLQKT